MNEYNPVPKGYGKKLMAILVLLFVFGCIFVEGALVMAEHNVPY